MKGTLKKQRFLFKIKNTLLKFKLLYLYVLYSIAIGFMFIIKLPVYVKRGVSFLFSKQQKYLKYLVAFIFLYAAMWGYHNGQRLWNERLTEIASKKMEFFYATTSSEITSQLRTGKKHPAFVKIAFDGRVVCSATVISETMAITAYHCLPAIKKAYYALFGTPITGHITNAEQTEMVPVVITAYSAPTDIALVEGDFQDFSSIPADFKGQFIPSVLEQERVEFVGCGYPRGGHFRCSRFFFETYRDFDMIMSGNIPHPGMSGGAVMKMVSLTIPTLGITVNYPVLVGVISYATGFGGLEYLGSPPVMGVDFYLNNKGLRLW